jgi:hypothetical protein
VTLIEATVATAIAATVTAATLGAAANAAHAAAGNPVRDALQATAVREARIALDLLKYRDATLSPQTVATSVPLATGTPMPATISIAVSPDPNGAATVTVTATANGERAETTESLDARSPLPGSQAVAPGLAPAPTGAP